MSKVTNKKASRWILAPAVALAGLALIIWFWQPTLLERAESQSSETKAQADSAQLVTPTADNNLHGIHHEALDRTKTGHAAQEKLDDQALADLLERRLTPAMKREINALLEPANASFEEQYGEQGGFVDLSRRAYSVPVAVIDDDGNTVVTDIMQPLPISDAKN